MKNPPDTLRQAFTLVEILAATAVLSILFTIMFSILQQTSKGWQAANRRVEASQVARLALDQIASDLENCVAVSVTNLPVPGLSGRGGGVGSVGPSYAFGFVHTNISDPARDEVGINSLAQGSVNLSQPNDYIFVVTPYPSSLTTGTGDLCEVGYIPAYVARASGYGNVRQGRYVLLRHSPVVFSGGGTVTTASARPTNDFLANSNWFLTPRLRDNEDPRNFFPVVDNLIAFQVEFLFTNSSRIISTNSSWGRPVYGSTRWNNPDGARDGLPLAADITLSVFDDKAAERLLRLRNLTQVLQPQEIQEMAQPSPNWSRIANAAVRATLQESVLVLKRRIFFKNAPP